MTRRIPRDFQNFGPLIPTTVAWHPPCCYPTGTSLIYRYVRIVRGSNSTTSRIIFNFFADGLDSAGVLRNLGQMYFTQDGPSAGRITFATNAGGGLTDKLTIGNSGRVGIGTTNPAAMLHVTGDVQV